MAKPNWKNRTVWAEDNLRILRGMNSEAVDLIYLDPPFNSKANYWRPIGSSGKEAGFKDIWGLDDIKIAWVDQLRVHNQKLFRAITATPKKSDMAYLIYMAPRLMEMRRVLKETGSMFLHCDPTMSHWLKVVLDIIFKNKFCFRNEIVWCYETPGRSKRHFSKKHDTILWYSKGKECTFNQIRIPYPEYDRARYALDDGDGKGPYYKRTINGREYRHYFNDGKDVNDWWEDLLYLPHNAPERTGYPTQKPETLLDRIIKAASNKGDVVLDPFCGCATALVVADRLGRDWAGIDISPVAVKLVIDRIKKDQGMWADVKPRTDQPTRTDQGKVPPYNCRQNKETLYGKQEGFCNGCQTHFQLRHLTVDHIISQREGGGDEIGNLQLLCHHCNSTKGARGMAYLKKALLEREIFARPVAQNVRASFKKTDVNLSS